MARRGYVVIPEFLPKLKSLLEQMNVQYQVIHHTRTFVSGISFILVSDKPAPEGWARFRTCKSCKGPASLGVTGTPTWYCEPCAAKREETAWKEPFSRHLSDDEALWRHYEWSRPAKEIEAMLPAWFRLPPGCDKVAEVRELLANRELPNVGPEREIMVSDALTKWRELNASKIGSA